MKFYKDSVIVDIPVGWKLAESERRLLRIGDYFYCRIHKTVCQYTKIGQLDKTTEDRICCILKPDTNCESIE